MHEEPKIKCQNLQMRTPDCLKYKRVSLKTNYHHVSLFLVSREMYINSLNDDVNFFVCTVQRTEFVYIVTIDLVMLHIETIHIYFWNYTEYVSTLCGSVGLRPLVCWNCGFESHRGHRCLSVVSVVCCQVEVSATDWSLVQRIPTDYGASFCVIKKPRKRGG